MSYENVIKIIPTLQSVALLGNSMKFLKKKRKRTKDFLVNATETIVGAAIIKEESDFLN